MPVRTGGRGLLAHSPADDIGPEQHPVNPSSPLFGYTSPTTVTHPSLASSAIGATALDATAPDTTNPASTPSTISSATHSICTPGRPTSDTTTALWLRPWRLGPGAQLLSSPCATVPDRPPARSVATLPAVPRWTTGPRQGRL